MHRVLVVALAVLAFASPSFAADLGGYKDGGSPCVDGVSYSWTGVRISALGGYNLTAVHGSTTAGETVTGYAFDRSNAVGELELGVDYQFRGTPIVLGVFGDVGVAGVNALTYGAKGRAGLAFGNALVYGFAGVEKEHQKVGDSYLPSSLAGFSGDPVGVAYGLGADVAFGPHWYGGVRWERVSFQSYSKAVTAASTSAKADEDRGLITLGYKF
jgi:opacity protein-like surface antigen